MIKISGGLESVFFKKQAPRVMFYTFSLKNQCLKREGARTAEKVETTCEIILMLLL